MSCARCGKQFGFFSKRHRSQDGTQVCDSCYHQILRDQTERRAREDEDALFAAAKAEAAKQVAESLGNPFGSSLLLAGGEDVKFIYDGKVFEDPPLGVCLGKLIVTNHRMLWLGGSFDGYENSFTILLEHLEGIEPVVSTMGPGLEVKSAAIAKRVYLIPPTGSLRPERELKPKQYLKAMSSYTPEGFIKCKAITVLVHCAAGQGKVASRS